jgi:hypothetical protein
MLQNLSSPQRNQQQMSPFTLDPRHVSLLAVKMLGGGYNNGY